MKLLVSVHCYQGDMHQMNNLWPAHVQHGAPVVVLSPNDSPVVKLGAWCRTEGKRCYIGPDSLDRQFFQLKALLEFDADWYLANDADSCLLSPGLPEYITSNSDAIVWSNKVPDDIHVRHKDYPLPRFALQPPYVFNRKTLERLVSKGQFDIRDTSNFGQYGTANGWVQTPYIDWYMMALCVWTDTRFTGFNDGASCPTSECPVGSSTPGDRHLGFGQMIHLVRNKGIRFIHSVKDRSVFDDLCRARTEYLSERP